MTTTKNYDCSYGGCALDASAIARLNTIYLDAIEQTDSAADDVGLGIVGSLDQFTLGKTSDKTDGNSVPQNVTKPESAFCCKRTFGVPRLTSTSTPGLL